MIREKKIFIMQVVLMFAFFGVLGIANKAEAQIVLPTSIHDILTPTQIDDLKIRQDVKDIQNVKRDEMLLTTSSNIPGAVLLMGANLDASQKGVFNEVFFPIGNGLIAPAVRLMARQPLSFSDPTNADGLAVRFAPPPF